MGKEGSGFRKVIDGLREDGWETAAGEVQEVNKAREWPCSTALVKDAELHLCWRTQDGYCTFRAQGQFKGNCIIQRVRAKTLETD